MRRHHLFSVTAALTALLVLGGCRKPEITTYTAPKDPAPAITGPAMSAANLPPSTTAAPAIRWELPPGWTDQGANNIRLGNILVTGPNNQRAEMTVTRFEGTVGGDLANVNRWRNQLQLPPIDAATLANAILHRDYPAGHMDAVDLVSDAPLGTSAHKTRTLVAWLPQADATWFFKLTGDDELVSAQRNAFSAFLASVEFSAAPANATPSIPSGPLPDGHPPINGGSAVSSSPAPSVPPSLATPTQSATAPSAPASSALPSASGPMTMANSTLPSSAVSSGNALVWSAPASWTEKPLGPVRKGSFAVGDADLSITAFPGDVGGLLANLNRWRGELQLDPLPQAGLPTATTSIPGGDPNLHFILVDLTGTSGGVPTRTLGAILPLNGDTYFFKLKGPAATVDVATVAQFVTFLATVKTR